MMSDLSFFQVLGLVLAAMVAGAALLMLFLGSVSNSFGEDAGAGCISLGAMLLVLALIAGYIVLS
jgi:hypothetical protein